MRYFFVTFLMLLAILYAEQALAADETPATPAPHTVTTDEAQRLYQAYGDAIYQIKVIDLTSSGKTGIGSGFQFDESGLIATNYHVIAEALQRSANNRIEFLHDNGEKGQLTIQIADVVNDLAIVKMDKPGKKWLTLGTSKLSKGAKLFSLGNPHDIGFTIIEGTYNGLSKESFIDKIHFSGSLNPGMSGGPAISHDGSVSGINVATSGNQISFLVPVEPLQKLLTAYRQQLPGYNFNDRAHEILQKQLLENQDHIFSELLKKPWESITFGPVIVPGKSHDALKCWGGTDDHKEKNLYEQFYSVCSTQDRIFLDNEFSTGLIFYGFNYITGKDSLNLMRFYNLYQDQYTFPNGDYKNAKEDDVTNFECNNSFIDHAGFRWKSSLCIRQYKKYPKIFDMHLYMAVVGIGNKGFTVTLTTQGVSKENALALADKFIKEIKPITAAPAEKQGGAP